MRMLSFFLATIFFFLSSSQSAHAQSSDWSISEFDTNITIQEEGTVHVTENITTDFGTEKHGIFRNIPYVYETDNGKYYTRVDINSITRDGEEEDYEIDKEGANMSIRIGDEDVTITGEHAYTIDYTVVGVLQGFENHDEFYWNVSGNYWDVPIQKVNTKLSIEGGEFTEGTCYVGPSGSTQPCNIEQSGDTIEFQSPRSLAPYEGMTIVASFPKGTVPLTTIEQPPTFLQQISSPEFFISLLVTMGIGLGIIIWNWARRGRDFIFFGKYLFDPNAKKILRPIGHQETIVVEYIPPEKLKPAEMGVLVDERADTLDVTSSIVDLAVNGYLKIKEIPKKWTFGKVDYELTRTKKTEKGLDTYEKELLKGLFESGGTVKVSSLKTKFYDNLKKVKEQLYKDVIEKDYFPHNPENVKNIYFAVFIAVIVLAFMLFIFNISQFYPDTIVTGISVALVVVGLTGLMFSRSMSRRTAKGAELYRRLKGYRLFLENVEKHKQKFLEDKNLFNTILPYAIVFGLTDKIAKSMKDMGIKPSSPTWYTGTHAFHAGMFAGSINNFSNSVSSSISSAPSSSGFSGGSSGGGFGGGGGGSW